LNKNSGWSIQMTRLEFGQWVRKQRKDMGLTQTELSAMVGLTDGQISNIEHGHRSASYEFCRKFAKIIGANYEDVERYAGLIGNSIPPEPELEITPIGKQIDQILKQMPHDKQKIVLSVVELFSKGLGGDRASPPHKKAETQPL
jgi:transcriptional regulator with XRE-family HTH domain